LEDDSGRSTTFDTDDVYEAIPDKEQKKFGEDLVSKLKGQLRLSSCSLESFTLFRASLVGM